MTLLQDLRYGVRILRMNPSFAWMAILTLALGIGASTMIFSIVDAVLLHPFPYKDASRLVAFHVQQANYAGPPDYSAPEFVDVRNGMRGFEDLIGYSLTQLIRRNGIGSERTPAAWVTTNTFSVLGVEPRMGRPLLPEDEKPEAPLVCAIGERFWREQLNADPNVLGSTLDLNGELRTVVGITPPRFQFLDASVWLPYSFSSPNGIRLEPVARLKPGVGVSAATAEFNAIARRIANTYPEFDPKTPFTASVRTLLDASVGSFKGLIYAVIAAVTTLLLIACANVGNLLLVRSTAREREIAIRSAVGATRGRLIQQLLVESWILAAMGGALGVFLAYFGLDALGGVLPRNTIPGEAVIAMNDTALWFAAGLTFVTTLLCGLAPALRTVRGRATGGRLRGALVIAEVSLSMILLMGAGLMTRTFFAITHVDLGFDPAHLLRTQLVVPRGKDRLLTEVRDSVGRLPGVIGAALTMERPPFPGGPVVDLDVPGKTHSGRWRTMLQYCDENYFKTLGRSITLGRAFLPADSGGQFIIVNQTFARAFFAGDEPVGRTVRFDFGRLRDAPPDANFKVVGVVSDAKNNGPREPVIPEAYLMRDGVRLMVRAAARPLSMVETIRKQVWAIDPNIVMLETGTVEQFIDDSATAEPRFGLISLGGFAGIGLVLVAVGVFSVMAYTVSMQTREIGVRVALGAQQSQILGMVLTKGLRLTGTGIAIGLLASLGLTRFLASQLWGVSATDPWTFAGVTAILIASSLAACYLPAWRAARVDPALCLRHE